MKAEKELLGLPGHYLLRFSRLHPDTLTLSVKRNDHKVTHHRKHPEEGIDEFIQRLQERHKIKGFVKKRLDDQATTIDSVKNFCKLETYTYIDAP